MNNEDKIHLKDCLADNNNNYIEDHRAQHKQINQQNHFYTLVKYKLHQNYQLEGQNEANDRKTTNKHEGELVMA